MKETERTVPVGDEWITLVDNPAEGPTRGTVILVPPFGMQARNLFPVALTLCRNGFDVVRMEGRDALGAGSGKIFDYRMSTAAADVVHTIDAVRSSSPLIVVGLSLSARAVVRALTTRECDGAVLLTPVVDVRSTLREVLQQDLVALSEAEGAALAQLRVLGQVVGWSYVRDVKEHGFETLGLTLGELARVRTPTAFLCGDEDPWVALSHAKQAAAATKPAAEVVVVQAASHELNRNPRVAMMYIEQLAVQCLALACHPDVPAVVPRFAEVIAELGLTSRATRAPSSSEERSEGAR